ncbi:MAG: hypothetical protein ACYS5V_17755 [Planctomycetota bacterium]|jgi:hypothetical protein
MSFKDLNTKARREVAPFILATSGYAKGKKFQLWVNDLLRKFEFTGHKILWELETIEVYFKEQDYRPTKRLTKPPEWIITLSFEERIPHEIIALTPKPDKETKKSAPKKVFAPKSLPELIDGLKDLGVHDFFTPTEMKKGKGAKEEATLRVVSKVIGILEKLPIG